jgi:hypothetical protein
LSKDRQLPAPLRNVFESGQVGLDKGQNEKFRNLLIEYSSIFSETSDDIGFTENIFFPNLIACCNNCTLYKVQGSLFTLIILNGILSISGLTIDLTTNSPFFSTNFSFSSTQCFHYASNAKYCYGVAIQETTEVPPNSEIFISGKPRDPIFRSRVGLVELNEK